jgi:hypothetical protein
VETLPNGDIARQSILLSALDGKALRSALGTTAQSFRADEARTAYAVAKERLTIGIANNARVRCLLRRWLKHHNCWINTRFGKTVSDFSTPTQTLGVRADGESAIIFLTIAGIRASEIRSAPWVLECIVTADQTPGNAPIEYRRRGDALRYVKRDKSRPDLTRTQTLRHNAKLRSQ